MSIEKIIYGDYPKDTYYLVDESDGTFIVHADYFGQESAMIFKIASEESDWSHIMLLDSAKKAVDLLNRKEDFIDS